MDIQTNKQTYDYKLKKKLCIVVNEMIKYQLNTNSEHHKMQAKQQHVCKEMNQFTINTNWKWILSFDIDWTIRVKYRK
jgi:uncharacterized HAD superfamily protein